VATTVVAVIVGSVASVLMTLAVVAAWGRARYARRLPFFRCRVGPPAVARRRRGARWGIRRTRAVWVDGVLLVRTGFLRLWLEPLPVGVAPDVALRALPPGEARGLGPHPVALRFTLGLGELEIAVAAEDAELLVGPFLTAGMSRLPHVPRDHG
jgi:hypothetical protein